MSEDIKHKTKAGVYWKFAQQFSNYVVGFVIGVAMARVLSPEDYGITALPNVFVAIASIFVGGGFFQALVRKQDLKDEDLATAFYYNLSVGIFFYVLLWFAAPYIADFYNEPILTKLVRIATLGFIYGALGGPQNVLLQRRLDFKTFALLSVASSLLQGAIGLTMAYNGFGLWALVVSGLVTGICYQLVLILKIRWIPRVGWSRESFRYLWNYGNKLMASALLDTGYNNIVPVIVGKFYSPAQLGHYNRAVSYASMATSNIHAVVSEVSFPVLSNIQGDNSRLISAYKRMIMLSCFVTLPLAMMLAALAHPLVIVLVTAKWEPCVILLQLICFSMMWYPVHGLNLNILKVTGRTDIFLRLEIIKKVIGLAIMCAFLPLGLKAFCAAGIGSSIISMYINSWYTGKYYGYGFWTQMKDLAPTLALSLTMFFAVLGITHMVENMYLQILIGGVVGAIIYIGGAFFFKLKQVDDVLYMLHPKQ